MIKIVLIGGGNVAFHLARVLLKTSGVSLIQVYNRSIDAIKYLDNSTQITDNIDKLVPADLYIISVSDDVIEKISAKINTKNGLIVHTSGSTSIDVLQNHKKYGVFYPLQTFSKARKVDFKSIPICIEANNDESLMVLEKLAKTISTAIYPINTLQRKQLHLAAVFVNNFVNYLYTVGHEICAVSDIDPKILHPLIKETANKITNLDPIDAQTGPARRGDKKVIKKHLENLNKNHKEIYKLLSQSIANTYGKKL